MKIYIIGPVGSGKTTLAKQLSKKYKTKYYELDCIVFDDDNNHRKRSIEETNVMFDKILKHKSWIIEDISRNRFDKGLEEADIIYYIAISKIRVYYRVIKRWFKQKLRLEKYNYPPTLFQFFDMIRTTKSYYKKEKDKLKKLKKYKHKVKFITKKDIKELTK